MQQGCPGRPVAAFNNRVEAGPAFSGKRALVTPYERRSRHQVDRIVFSRVFDYCESDIVARPGYIDVFVVHFH